MRRPLFTERFARFERLYKGEKMSEFLELKNLILEMKNTVFLLLPKCVPLSYVCDVSGKSRQTITAYVKSNLEPQVEFWLENGKIMLSQTAALKILRRYNEK